MTYINTYMYILNVYLCYLWRYERGDDGMLRDSREDSLVDTYKTTPPMSHTESPRGKIILYSVFYYIFANMYVW